MFNSDYRNSLFTMFHKALQLIIGFSLLDFTQLLVLLSTISSAIASKFYFFPILIKQGAPNPLLKSCW